MRNRSDVQASAVDGPRVVDGPKVREVLARMPAERDVVDLADVFGLLAVPGRLRLLMALLEGSCACATWRGRGGTQRVGDQPRSADPARPPGGVGAPVRPDGLLRLADAHVRMLLDVAMAHIEHTELVHDHGEEQP